MTQNSGNSNVGKGEVDVTGEVTGHVLVPSKVSLQWFVMLQTTQMLNARMNISQRLHIH